jgi:hypothetical protein
MAAIFEAGKLNTTTGAEEADDQIVRTDIGITVTPGLVYTFAHDSEGVDPKLFWYDDEGSFLSYEDSASGTAPEGADTARITINTSGATEFDWTFTTPTVYGFTPSITMTGNPGSFTWYLGDGTVVTGFDVEHNYDDSTLKQVEVLAQTKDWQALSALDLKECDVVGTLELTNLDVMDQAVIDISDNPLLTTVVFAPAVSGTILQLVANDCSLGYIQLLPLDGCFDLSNAVINLKDNGMTAEEVDHLLSDIDLITADGYESRVLHIDGLNALPTDGSVTGWDGIAAVTSLEAKGWTVNIATE